MQVVGVSRGRRASDSGRKENEETWQLKKTWGSGTVTQSGVGCESLCGNRGEKTEKEALKHGQDVANPLQAGGLHVVVLGLPAAAVPGKAPRTLLSKPGSWQP